MVKRKISHLPMNKEKNHSLIDISDSFKEKLIEVVSEVDNGDGTCDLKFEITDEFIEGYKKHTGKEEVTQEEITQFIYDMLLKIIKEENGGEIVEFNPVDHEQTK